MNVKGLDINYFLRLDLTENKVHLLWLLDVEIHLLLGYVSCAPCRTDTCVVSVAVTRLPLQYYNCVLLPFFLALSLSGQTDSIYHRNAMHSLCQSQGPQGSVLHSYTTKSISYQMIADTIKNPLYLPCTEHPDKPH